MDPPPHYKNHHWGNRTVVLRGAFILSWWPGATLTLHRPYKVEKIGDTGGKQGHGTHVGHTAWVGDDVNRVVYEVCLIYSLLPSGHIFVTWQTLNKHNTFTSKCA